MEGKEGKGWLLTHSLTQLLTYSTHFVFARNEQSVFLFLLHPHTTHVGLSATTRMPLDYVISPKYEATLF